MKNFLSSVKKSMLLRIIIWAVVILIPLMYSYFYLKAFWNPYGSLQDVKVGIVNLDMGNDGENKGKELKEKLLDNDTLKFESVNSEDANTSLANQEYYAIITIPKDFTENLKNAENIDRKITTITYSPNKKSNYLASQIIKSAVNNVEKELRSEITKAVVGSLSDKLNEVPEKLEQISDGTKKIEDGTTKLATNYSEFDNGVNSAYEGSKNLDDGINQVLAGTQSLKEGTQSIDTLISSVESLATNYSKINSGIEQYVNGVNSSNEQVTSMVTDLLTYAQYAKAGHPELGVDNLNKAITTANALAVASSKTDSKEVGNTLVASSKKINSGIQTLNSKVSGLSKIIQGATTLNQGVEKLKNGSTQLTEGMEKLAVNSKKVKDGINTLNDGTKKLNSELNSGIDSTKVELKKLDGLDEYASNPIEVKEESYGEIEAYGVGFAPYFISLSLWVGALMAFVVLYYDQENRFKLFGKNAEKKILRTLLYGGLAVVQGLSLGFLLKLGLGYEVTNIWLYYGSCVLIAVLFLNIVEFLIVTFGDIGKFVALIVLILQLAATGGTFPVETIPQGFQKITPFLPMTYTIKLMKESLVLIDGNLLFRNFIILFIMTMVFIGINAFNDIVRKGVEIAKNRKE